VAAHVDDYGTGKDQQRIFAISDVYPVGVRPGEPLFGDLSHWLAVTGYGIFVVRQIALRFQIALLVDVDAEGALEEGEHLLLNCGDMLFSTV
jgi:hypothetical protein